MLFIFKFHTVIVIYFPDLCASVNSYADLILIFEDEDGKAGRLRNNYIMA